MTERPGPVGGGGAARNAVHTAISLEDVCVSYSERRTYWKWFLEICDEPAGDVHVDQGQERRGHCLSSSSTSTSRRDAGGRARAGMCAAEAAGLSANRASANRRAFFGSGGGRSECFFPRAFSALEPLWNILNSTRVRLVPITPRKGVLHVRYRSIAARITPLLACPLLHRHGARIHPRIPFEIGRSRRVRIPTNIGHLPAWRCSPL